MKNLSSLLILPLLACFLVLAGCSKSITGKYFQEDDPNKYITFTPGGLWTTYDGGGGKYLIDGTTIILQSPMGSRSGEIKGNRVEFKEMNIFMGQTVTTGYQKYTEQEFQLALKAKADREAALARKQKAEADAEVAQREAAEEKRKTEMWAADRAPRLAAAAELLKTAEERIAYDRGTLANNSSLTQTDKTFLLSRIARCQLRIADLRAYQQMRNAPSEMTAGIIETIMRAEKNRAEVHDYYTDPFYIATDWILLRDIAAAKRGK